MGDGVPLPHQPGIQVFFTGSADGDDPLVTIDVSLLAPDRAAPDLVGEGQCRRLAASIACPVPFAQLASFRSIDPEEPNALTANLDRIAINDRCCSDDFGCHGRRCGEQRYGDQQAYRGGSWSKKRRVVAKVEWHPGELYPRVGFIVTNLSRPAKRVVAFYNHRGTAEQFIKEGKNAIKWTRLSCRKFRNNEVRLQLHALAYNLGNFMRTLALPREVAHWSLTTLREKLVKIGAKVVRHGRYVTFQLAEVAVSRDLFEKILALIGDLRRRPVPA